MKILWKLSSVFGDRRYTNSGLCPTLSITEFKFSIFYFFYGRNVNLVKLKFPHHVGISSVFEQHVFHLLNWKKSH